jgi:hypothetical protein
MGRKAILEVNEDAKTMDLAHAEQEQHDLTIQEAEEEFGDGQPYERLRLENEVRFYQDQMATSLIEIGKRLIRMKANEEHGGFLQVLDSIQMSPRSAQYAMTAARKFSNTKSISYLSNTKLIALSVLDDDEIQGLEDGNQVAGMTLDDIEQMSVKELRESLRKEREKREKDRKAQDAAIEQKETKINDMENQLRYREPPTARDLAEGALIPIKKDFLDEIGSVDFHLERAIATIDRAQRIEGIKVDQLDAWMGEELIGTMIERLKELYDQIDEAIQNIRPIEPEKE